MNRPHLRAWRSVAAGDLSESHIGRRIQIHGLHQPGTDWDSPKVTVTGTLQGLRRAADHRAVWVDLSPRTAALDSPLPPSWLVDVL